MSPETEAKPKPFRWHRGMRAQVPAGPHIVGVDLDATVLDVDDRGIPVAWAVHPPNQLPRVITGYGAPGWCEAVWEGAKVDEKDPVTLGAMLGAVREAHGDPTIHLSPETRDRLDNAEPYVVWHVNRHTEGEDEWLRDSGAWGALEEGHRDPPITARTEFDALSAALETAP